MSRTNRNYINFYTSSDYRFHRSWLGIDPAGRFLDSDKEVEQNRLLNGYDGVSLGWYSDAFHGGYWKEEFQGRTRKFYKRRFQKGRRAYDKVLIAEGLGE